MSARALVHFIGAGPGAPDLITLRGARLLAQAQVVLFDALIDPAFRSMAPQARWIDVGKRGFVAADGQAGAPACGPQEQGRINALIVAHAQKGLRVVRLKGGDPSLFGRLEEELLAVQSAGLSCEVVPGVTAALAAAAQAQRPLTRRGHGRSLRIQTAFTGVPSPRSEGPDLSTEGPIGQASEPAADTEVFYMGGRQLLKLEQQLREQGWPADTPCLLVSQAGRPDALVSSCVLEGLSRQTALHAGRPTLLTVGAGAGALGTVAGALGAADAAASQAGAGFKGSDLDETQTLQNHRLTPIG